MLVVSIAYAGVLSYYGKIVGTVNIQPPIFYASSEGTYPKYKLLINAPPTSYNEISFYDGTNILFATSPLGITSFYSAIYTFTVKAKANATDYDMTLEFGVLHKNGRFEPICSAIVTINSTDYQIYQASCSAKGLDLSPDDSFAWRISGAYESVTYYVMPDGTTKVEVYKV